MLRRPSCDVLRMGALLMTSAAASSQSSHRGSFPISRSDSSAATSSSFFCSRSRQHSSLDYHQAVDVKCSRRYFGTTPLLKSNPDPTASPATPDADGKNETSASNADDEMRTRSSSEPSRQRVNNEKKAEKASTRVGQWGRLPWTQRILVLYLGTVPVYICSILFVGALTTCEDFFRIEGAVPEFVYAVPLGLTMISVIVFGAPLSVVYKLYESIVGASAPVGASAADGTGKK